MPGEGPVLYDGHNPALERWIPAQPLTILDLGCGKGGMAEWLGKGGHTVDGVTWSAEEAQHAQAHCRNVLRWDLNQGLPGLAGSSYDLIVCSHLLEHIAYPQALLHDAHLSLKPGGALLVAIPNLFFWRDRLSLIRGKFRYQASGTFDYTHLRWYTRETMYELLQEHGFAVEEFAADGWIPLPGLRRLIGPELRRSVNGLACRWMPGLFGQQLLFRARKS